MGITHGKDGFLHMRTLYKQSSRPHCMRNRSPQSVICEDLAGH